MWRRAAPFRAWFVPVQNVPNPCCADRDRGCQCSLYPSIVLEGPDSPPPDMQSAHPARQSPSREAKMGPRARSSADTMALLGADINPIPSMIEFLNTSGTDRPRTDDLLRVNSVVAL